MNGITNMADKKSIAKKMESKTYTNTRCGHCGKFGHGHETHSGRAFELPKINSLTVDHLNSRPPKRNIIIGSSEAYERRLNRKK